MRVAAGDAWAATLIGEGEEAAAWNASRLATTGEHGGDCETPSRREDSLPTPERLRRFNDARGAHPSAGAAARPATMTGRPTTPFRPAAWSPSAPPFPSSTDEECLRDRDSTS